MKKISEILGGLIFLIIPIYLWIINWNDFGVSALSFLKGGIMWLTIIIGTIILILGINDLKE